MKRFNEYNTDGNGKKKENKGLKTSINPVLLSSNLNLVAKQYRNQNPYLSIGQHAANNKTNKRFERGLKFHEKGEISSQIEQQREEQKRELEIQREQTAYEQQQREREAKELNTKIANGDLPDVALGEDKYLKALDEVPKIEWWDRAYLDEKMGIREKYIRDEIVEDESDDDSDEEKFGPSIRYVHHPVPMKVHSNKDFVAKVYLTKDEQKKIRRNRRKLQREEKETKIRSGLEPKPEAKVKLANMMSVYENDSNIVDPTKWEQEVKAQVDLRKQKHLQENAKRHQEAELNRKSKDDRENKTDTYCQVFSFKNLTNPKIRYKLTMNSKQLLLRGACLRVTNDGPGIIVVVGKEKSCKFFNKLVTKRLKWDEPYEDQSKKIIIDMTGNYCKQIWEGILGDCHFPKWFMKVCQDETELSNTLAQFDGQSLFSVFKQSN